MRYLLPIVLGLVIWLCPIPEGIEPNAWKLLAIFIATVAGIIAQPLPMGAVALIGIVLTAITGTLTVDEALSGFSNSVIWLIVTAFFISRGFIKTGLGTRIAYLFMAAFGKKSLGLSYGFVATDLLLSPAIPSNTARTGGIIVPIILSTARAYESHPNDESSKRIGSYLILSSFQSQNITSAMFLTAMAANPLAAQLAGDQGVNITWANWALAASLPGLLSLMIIPFILYKMYPPVLKETPAAARQAKEKLAEIGAMKSTEWTMLGTFFLLIVLWILGSAIHIHATLTALVGLCVLVMGRVLTWEDILNETNAWNTLVWFSALVMMASFLNKLGMIPWFAHSMKSFMGGFHWTWAFAGVMLIYFYSHYFFASNTAHVSSMYAPFLAVAISTGAPPILSALVLAFFSNLFSGTTHYGTGPAPVYFGSGYVPMATWWTLGFVLSVVNILIWVGVGSLWWKLLGFW